MDESTCRNCTYRGEGDWVQCSDCVQRDERRAQANKLNRAENLLRAIRDGKHSLPGTLVQIDRYFGKETDA